jgi:hypothetical protein
LKGRIYSGMRVSVSTMMHLVHTMIVEVDDKIGFKKGY